MDTVCFVIKFIQIEFEVWDWILLEKPEDPKTLFQHNVWRK